MQTRQRSLHRAAFLSGRAARCAVIVSMLLAPRPATATPEYPEAVDVALGTACPDPNSRCLMCHTTARGGQGTAAQPFAIELRRHGLTRGRDVSLLRAALMALPNDSDSDRDGDADKEELVRCGNPSGEDLGIGPEYGCDGARLAPLEDRDAGPLAGALAFVLVGIVLGRRARRTP